MPKLDKNVLVGEYATLIPGGIGIKELKAVVAKIKVNDLGMQWSNGPQQQWNLATTKDGNLRETSTGQSSRFIAELEEAHTDTHVLFTFLTPLLCQETGKVKALRFVGQKEDDKGEGPRSFSPNPPIFCSPSCPTDLSRCAVVRTHSRH